MGRRAKERWELAPDTGDNRITNVLHSLRCNGYKKTVRMLERKKKKASEAIGFYRLSSETWSEYTAIEAMFDLVETDKLLSEAERLSLEIPSDKADWWHPEGTRGGISWKLLTKKGKSRVRKLIREEHRRNVEWWVKVLSPILALIVSALGLVVALTSILRR